MIIQKQQPGDFKSLPVMESTKINFELRETSIGVSGTVVLEATFRKLFEIECLSTAGNRPHVSDPKSDELSKTNPKSEVCL